MTTRIAAGALGAGAALLAALCAVSPAPSQAAPGPKPVSFVTDVKPILERSCVGCHGQGKAKSGYRMDSKESAMKGGQIAEAKKKPALVPKKSAESLVVEFISATKEDKQNDVHPMPPKQGERLSPEQIALIKRWIDEGAEWPDGVTLTAPRGRGGRGGR
ncbi:MAG TPA: c-type cytochrome domain-containing protein [Planctomycetota bacterium]|nr:c-type cytochrome domain-containing protein [Planctomycetota bacterium]